MGIRDFFRRRPTPAPAPTPVGTPPAIPRRGARAYRLPKAAHYADGFMPRGGYERVPSALGDLRRRARDLAHNNPYANRAVNTLTAYIVGPGIRVAITGDADYAHDFDLWAASTAPDHDRRLTLYGLQSLAVRMMMEAGEAFIVVRHEEDGLGLLRPSFQLIDPDLIAESARPKYAANKVLSGVEIDPKGQVVGYHIYETAGDGGMSSMRTTFVRAADMIHMFEQVLPGQLRGIPRGTQALTQAADIDDLIGTMLIKARTEACLGLVITTDADDYSLGDDYDDGDPDDLPLPEKLAPGLIMRLRPGESATSINPGASSSYIDYARISIQAIAISYRCTYAQLSGDLERANFSSLKAGNNLFFQDIAETRGIWIMPWILRMERLFRDDYEIEHGRKPEVTVTTVPPSAEAIDPTKETAAVLAKLEAGLMSWDDAVLAQGKDPRAHLEQLREERKRLSDAGITITYSKQMIGSAGQDDLDDEGDQDSEGDAAADPPTRARR